MIHHHQQQKEYEYQGGTACFSDDPCVFNKARGSLVYDEHNRQYVDLCASFGSQPLGHNHPQIIAHIQDYLDQSRIMSSFSDVYSTTAKSEFIRYLGDILPDGFTSIALSTTGSDAVEFAIKTAMAITQKPAVMVCEEGYHGLGLGSTFLTGIKRFRSVLPADVFDHVSTVSRTTSAAEILSLIQSSQQTTYPIGQMIIEPILGRGGVWVCEEHWLAELKDGLDQLGGLLIYDEVFVGAGRAGKLFYADKTKAHMTCLAKGIGGGMAVSCVAASPEITQIWPKNEGEALHTGTTFGHALSCAVAHKTLEIIVEQDLSRRSSRLGQKVKAMVNKQIPTHPTIVQCRGAGLMIGLDLKTPQKGAQLSSILREKHRIIATPCGVEGECLSITPSLIIDEDLLMSTISQILETAAFMI